MSSPGIIIGDHFRLSSWTNVPGTLVHDSNAMTEAASDHPGKRLWPGAG
jgi:hypothetical protein